MPIGFTKVQKGFTLIELLIVVAIIAILAAIAVPNFLEAQTRAKVSRAKSDMRTLVTGLESYYIDNNKFPDVPRNSVVPPIKLGGAYSRAALPRLSTPIAYLTSALMLDPFARPTSAASVSATATNYYGYANAQASDKTQDMQAVGVSTNDTDMAKFQEHGFVLQSIGPDVVNYALLTTDPNQGFPNAYARLVAPTGTAGQNFLYDPTNGTISTGDLVRTRKVQN